MKLLEKCILYGGYVVEKSDWVLLGLECAEKATSALCRTSQARIKNEVERS